MKLIVLYAHSFINVGQSLKVALQISEENSIFIQKTPEVENHRTTGESKELLRPRSTPTGITVYFYMSSSAHLHTGNTQKKVSNKVSYKDIMETNYVYFEK